MTTKKNAARVAVVAKPCQKQPDLQPRDALDCIALGLPLSAMTQAPSLPSADQAMLTAIAHVQHSLEHLVRVRCDDKEWDDKDVDVDFAVDLALTHIRRMREELPLDRSTFENRWHMAGAAINLGARSFSRPDSMYCHWLRSAQRQFEVLVEMVEFVDEEARYGD